MKPKTCFTFSHSLKIRIWILLIPMLYVFIEFTWRPSFVRGKIGGIYWLFILVQKTVLTFSALAIIISFVLFVAKFVFRKAQRGNPNLVNEASISFLLSSFIFIFVFLSIAVQYRRGIYHLDRLSVEKSVYYLSAYQASSLSAEFGLYECDALGIFCKQIYRSNHIEHYETRFIGHLAFEKTVAKIEIHTPSCGVIYEYELPENAH